MAGVSAVSMVNYMYSLKSSYSQNNDELTAATRAKLSALGVDTKYIKTEAEGQIKLKEAQIERFSNSSEESQNNSTDDVLEEAKELAAKLDVYIASTDTIDDIIDKLTAKIEQMKEDAGEDFDKLADVNYYERELAMIEKSNMSQLELSASMNLTANLNIAFHGLY